MSSAIEMRPFFWEKSTGFFIRTRKGTSLPRAGHSMRIGSMLGKKAKWKMHRNAGIYGFNISSSHLSLSLLQEERQITRRRRWMIFISLNSFHGRLASNTRMGGKRREFLRLWELRAHCASRLYIRTDRCIPSGNNPPALDLLLYVRSNVAALRNELTLTFHTTITRDCI